MTCVMRMVLTLLLLVAISLAGFIPGGNAAASETVPMSMAQAESAGFMKCCAQTDESNFDRVSSCITDCHYLASDQPLRLHSSVSPFAQSSACSPHQPVIAGFFRPPIVS